MLQLFGKPLNNCLTSAADVTWILQILLSTPGRPEWVMCVLTLLRNGNWTYAEIFETLLKEKTWIYKVILKIFLKTQWLIPATFSLLSMRHHWPIFRLFLFCLLNLKEYNCRLRQDLNSDCRWRRQSRYPLIHNHAPFYFLRFNECLQLKSDSNNRFESPMTGFELQTSIVWNNPSITTGPRLCFQTHVSSGQPPHIPFRQF